MRTRSWPGMWFLAPIVAIGAIVVALLAFVDYDEDAQPPESLGAVADFTGRFLGESVTVSGTVGEKLEQGDAFALEGPDPEDRDLVVVVPAPGADLPPLETGESVTATGVVHGTDESGLVDTPEGIELDFSDEFRDRAVIVSSRIEPGAA